MHCTLEPKSVAPSRRAAATAARPKIDHRAIRRAMHDSDAWVIELDYVDSKGLRTRRVVSPIRFLGRDRLLALCLCRQEPRQFSLNQCCNVRLIPAAEVMMPVEIKTLGVHEQPTGPESFASIEPPPCQPCQTPAQQRQATGAATKLARPVSTWTPEVTPK